MRKFGLAVLLSGLLSVGGTALADHNDPVGSAGLLEHEAGELDQMVRSSYLNYNVKMAVFQFSGTVQQLLDCVRYGGRALPQDHSSDVGVVAGCQYQLQNTRMSFRQVARYLGDTQFDFPQIYQQFRETQRVLRAINGGGGGPIVPPTSVMCIARDRGWEEHAGGHRGFGRNVYEAQSRALAECQRSHGRCVIQSCN